jgi:hypothetical protein
MIQALAQLFNPQCRDPSFLRTGGNIFSVSPIAIVAQPWLGRHQVYGIFLLPDEHQLNYPILLTVKGAGQYRKEADMVKVNVDQNYPVSGHYVLRVHLRTRAALAMILRGLLGQLQDPGNWILSYTLVDGEPVPTSNFSVN